jgi:hypothetical protein
VAITGENFTVSINATLGAALLGGGLYSPSSIYVVQRMQGQRLFVSPDLTVASNITGVAAIGSLLGNDNKLYPDASVVLNGQGLSYSVSPAATIGGVTGTFSLINLYSGNQIYEEQGNNGTAEAVLASSAQVIPLFSTASSSSVSSPSSSAARSSSAPSSRAAAAAAAAVVHSRRLRS